VPEPNRPLPQPPGQRAVLARRQLRGEATGRQVDGARVAVVTAGGGVPSGAMLLRGPG
jgi:hypothetical protein